MRCGISDDVAYVRFASVYRDFQDVSEFQEEIERLGRSDGEPKTRGDRGARLDHAFMREALAQAEKGIYRTWPNPSVGAVVVADGVIAGAPRHAPAVPTRRLRR